MDQSDDIKDLVTALIKAQAEIQFAPLDKTNPHYKNDYASLESVINTVKGPLGRHGLCVTQLTNVTQSGQVVLITQISHTSGQFLRGVYPVISSKEGSPQAMGSGLSYSKRYALQAALLVPTQDDDGNEAEGKPSSPAAPQPTNRITSTMSPKEAYSEQEPPPWTVADEFSVPDYNSMTPEQKTVEKPRMLQSGGPSEKQLKRLYAISKSAGWNQAEVDNFIVENFKVYSREELSILQYNKLCDHIEGKKK